MNYTHLIISGIAKGLQCCIYKNVKPIKSGLIYIRTQDGRCFWMNENELIPLTNEDH